MGSIAGGNVLIFCENSSIVGRRITFSDNPAYDNNNGANEGARLFAIPTNSSLPNSGVKVSFDTRYYT